MGLISNEVTAGYSQDVSTTLPPFQRSCHADHGSGSFLVYLGWDWTVNCPSLWQFTWLLMKLQELVIHEEASRPNPDQFLQILCLNYVVPSAKGSYILCLAVAYIVIEVCWTALVNKLKGSIPFLALEILLV